MCWTLQGVEQAGKGVRTSQWIEQAGKGSAPQWVEQAGKGAAVIWTRFTFDPERAPAESPYKNLKLVQVNLSGGALGVNGIRRPTFRLPPSQLVQSNETSVLLPSLFIL
jgi:hypothetical protein